jgi:hypothetical protein
VSYGPASATGLLLWDLALQQKVTIFTMHFTGLLTLGLASLTLGKPMPAQSGFTTTLDFLDDTQRSMRSLMSSRKSVFSAYSSAMSVQDEQISSHYASLRSSSATPEVDQPAAATNILVGKIVNPYQAEDAAPAPTPKKEQLDNPAPLSRYKQANTVTVTETYVPQLGTATPNPAYYTISGTRTAAMPAWPAPTDGVEAEPGVVFQSLAAAAPQATTVVYTVIESGPTTTFTVTVDPHVRPAMPVITVVVPVVEFEYV